MAESMVDLLSAVVGDIIRETGECSPADLIEAARSKQSPIHGCFTWDANEALEKHLLVEARKYLRIVRVSVNGPETPPQRLVHVNIDDAGTYMPMSKVIVNQTLFDSAKFEFIRHLRGVVKGAQEFIEAAAEHDIDDPVVQIAKRSMKSAQTAIKKLA